ncbi:MAG: cupin domain-containing protein [Candidatus Latescibacterota bacterium]|nr:MAG: cupin domain-containing protein [Candidatus Latescibacterota bacterium]
MSEQERYSIKTEVRFKPLELIDIQQMVSECKEEWFNQTLCRVNDCVVRLGIIKGEFHWHKHDNEDEFFYVVDGQLFIDLEDQLFELGPKQGLTVPKGVIHRTRAPGGVVILMMEGSGVVPTGD